MMLDGKPLESMFSTRDPVEHKHLKTPVAGAFALSTMRQLEPLVDECSDIFIDAMMKRSPAVIDLGTWVQYYAFDVIGAITFLKRFGFMEQGRDVNNMIGLIEDGLVFLSTISFIPGLHRWLLGNARLMKILHNFQAVRDKDPFPNILRVSWWHAMYSTLLRHGCRLREVKSKHTMRSREISLGEICFPGYASSGLRTRSGWETGTSSTI